MSAGFSLISVLLALSLGTSAVLLALDRYQTLALMLPQMRQRASQQYQVRLVLFELARDLRLHGAAGCASLNDAPAPAGSEVSITYAAGGWSVVDTDWDEPTGRLRSVAVNPGLTGDVAAPRIALSSCAHLDLLARDVDYRVRATPKGLVLEFSPAIRLSIGGSDGHHRASLAVGPLVVRRYRLLPAIGGRGTLVREQEGRAPQRLMERVRAFSLYTAPDRMHHIELQLADDPEPWRLAVAPRQRGISSVLVMTLMLACSLLLAAMQRLQLDEVRLVRHQQDWWRALHVAEYALIEAERRVAGERGGAVTGGECRRIELRGAQDPCYVVEQLDADFRGECLFRVTVRARGDDERTVVRLQSLFSVGAQARRLAWTEVF